MRRLAAIALFAAGCGTTQHLPDSGITDAGIGLRPVSVVVTTEPFPPVALVYDFDGNFVAARADVASLLTLDPDGLGAVRESPVGDGGPWEVASLRVGRAGSAYLLTSDGRIYALELNDDLAEPYAAIAPPRAFTVRREDLGVAFAPQTGGIQLLDVSARDAGFIPLAGDIDDLASDGIGQLYAATSIDGGCNGIALNDGGSFALDGIGPCALALTQDNQTLWVAARVDGGAEVWELAARELPTSTAARASYFIPALDPAQVVLAEDASAMGVLGRAPGPTVAYARALSMQQGFGFQTVDSSNIPSATSGIFGDLSTLYVADPLNSSIDLVR